MTSSGTTSIVSFFRYLGPMLLSTNNDFTVVERNLRRAQEKWGRLAKILGREGLYKRTAGRFYVEVVQAVLLFGSETWFMTPRLEKALEGFRHRAAWRIPGMVHKRQQDGMWVYPPIGAALEMVGLEEIGIYISRHQNTFAQYIVTRNIMDLCLAEEWKPAIQLSMK